MAEGPRSIPLGSCLFRFRLSPQSVTWETLGIITRYCQYLRQRYGLMSLPELQERDSGKLGGQAPTVS